MCHSVWWGDAVGLRHGTQLSNEHALYSSRGREQFGEGGCVTDRKACGLRHDSGLRGFYASSSQWASIVAQYRKLLGLWCITGIFN